MAVIRIPDTSSFISTITGKTYSSFKRAVAAEASSFRMKKTVWEKKSPVPEEINDFIDYDYNLPNEMKRWSHKGGDWLYEHKAWDGMTYTELLKEYGLGIGGDDHTTDEALPKILAKNYPDHELVYYEDSETGEREWKIVRKGSSKKSSDTDNIETLISLFPELEAAIRGAKTVSKYAPLLGV